MLPDNLSDYISAMSTGGVGAGIGWVVARLIDRRHDDRRLASDDSGRLLQQALDRISALEESDARKSEMLSQMARDLGRSEGQNHADAATIKMLEHRLDSAMARISQLESEMHTVRGERDRLRQVVDERPIMSECPVIGVMTTEQEDGN